jgi:uncharacterized membrane protein YhfC
MSTNVIIVWVLAIGVMVLFPITVAIWFQRRSRVRWATFFYGAAVFAVFQLLTRVPALTVLAPKIGPVLAQSPALVAPYLLGLGLSAGLFESVGRWTGYRWLFRAPMAHNWQHGVAYGIGHAAIESILLVGGASALNLIQGIALTSSTVEQLQAAVPLATLQQTLAAREQYMAVTWSQPIWAAFERLCTLPFHVAMSLVVLFAFTRRRPGWLWLAVAIHGLADASLVMLVQLAHLAPWVVNAFLAVWAGASLWFIMWARTRTGSRAIAPRHGSVQPESSGG